MSDWIPLTDGATARWPIHGEHVDIFASYRRVDYIFNRTEHTFDQINGNKHVHLNNVSHWMPVQEPPTNIMES